MVIKGSWTVVKRVNGLVRYEGMATHAKRTTTTCKNRHEIFTARRRRLFLFGMGRVRAIVSDSTVILVLYRFGSDQIDFHNPCRKIARHGRYVDAKVSW